MKVLSDEALAVIGSGEIIMAGAAYFGIGDGYRFWSGIGPRVHAGQEFLGIGARALIAPISNEIGGAATGLTLTLPGIDPDVAATIETVDYAQKPVVIWRWIFDAAGRTLLDACVVLRGRLDAAPIKEVAGGMATIDFVIENSARDLSRGGAQRRADVYQRILGGANDGGMKFVSIAGEQTLNWGKRPENAPLRG